MPRLFAILAALAVVLPSSSAGATGTPTAPRPADGAVGVGLDPDLCTTIVGADAAPMTVSMQGRARSTDNGADFTIVVIPDTQFLSERAGDVFARQTRWIVENRESRNIVYVAHVGDVVDDAEFQEQWDTADTALSLLEDPVATGLPDGIPYGIAVGNHDQYPADSSRTDGDEGGTTVLYEAMYGVSRFESRSYYGGHFDFGDPSRYGNNMDNHYALFSAAGMDFLALYMEYEERNTATRRAVLEWADGVLQSYPERRAIVVVHFLILPGPPDDCEWSAHGAAVYEQFKDNANVFLMLSGHLDLAGRRTDIWEGHRIHTVVQDYQSHGSEYDGWLRVYTFSPASGTIRVETIGTEDLEHLPGDDHEFTLPYEMVGGLPWETIGTRTDVADGAEVCVPWPGRAHGVTYQWRATVADGTAVRTGPAWSFTAACLDGDCDDGNPCTDDGCDGGACVNTARSGACDDGDACTADDVCRDARCVGTPRDCDDGEPCTDDACDDGLCVHSANTAPCDDGDPCTDGDGCAAGLCAGAARDCDDGNACSADSCAAGDCVHAYAPVPDCCVRAADCDDGDPGTVDTCDPGGTCRNAVDIDAGSTDAGSTDAGSTDAGSTDAGSTDAGSTDAGSTDAGSTDVAGADVAGADAVHADVAGADAVHADGSGADGSGETGGVFRDAGERPDTGQPGGGASGCSSGAALCSPWALLLLGAALLLVRSRKPRSGPA